MHVPANTQAHGAFKSYEDRVYRETDSEWEQKGWGPYEEPYRQEVNASYKGVKYYGDHKSPGPYHRDIFNIEDDTPFILKRLRDNDGWRQSESYMSRNRGLGNFIYDFNIDEHLQNADREANVKALNNLLAAKAQLAVDLAESNRTYGMIADNATKAGRALLAARRGRWGEIPDILEMSRRSVLTGKFAANRWLEYQYGWKPLFGSIHGYQEAYKEGLRKKDMLVTGKGSSHITLRKQGSWDEGANLHFVDGGVSTKYTARVKNEHLVNADRLGVLNPASIAWELYPFSFVVDWFVPIGSLLSAVTATAGLEFVSGYTTYSYKHTYAEEKFRHGYQVETIQNGKYRESRGFMHRWVESNFKTPLPYADTDPFGKGRTARGASALALIRQLLK